MNDKVEAALDKYLLLHKVVLEFVEELNIAYKGKWVKLVLANGAFSIAYVIHLTSDSLHFKRSTDGSEYNLVFEKFTKIELVEELNE